MLVRLVLAKVKESYMSQSSEVVPVVGGQHIVTV